MQEVYKRKERLKEIANSRKGSQRAVLARMASLI